MYRICEILRKFVYLGAREWLDVEQMAMEVWEVEEMQQRKKGI